MTPKKNITNLRQQAEEKLSQKKPAATPATDAETLRLVHELQVHQIELEMQNEELVQARAESEAIHRQYTDLYDFAPVGYFTLARDGAISRVNLAGANLLEADAERGKLLKRRFGLFVSPQSRPAFAAFLEKVFSAGGEKQTCEVELLRGKTESFWAQIEAAYVDSDKTCRAVLVDISARVQADESLRASEMKFRQTFDISPVGIVMVGLDKRFIRCNLAFAQSLGYGTEELVGKLIEDITLPEDSQIGMAEMMAIMKGEITQSQVHKRYLRKDGQVVWGEVTISLIRDSEGRAQYFLAIIQDITARKQAEEILKASEERFATMFHSNPAAIAISRLNDGRLADVNATWLEVTGYACAEAVGHTPLELNLWGQPEQRERLVETVRKQGQARGEMQLRRKSGELRDLLMSAELIELKGERYLLTMAQDITERKRAEAKVLRAQEAYRALADNSPDSVDRFDREFRHIYINATGAAIVGKTPDEVIGKTNREIGVPDVVATLWENRLRAVFETGEPLDVEDTFPITGGTGFFSTRCVAERSADGTVQTVLAVSRNITERKQAEDVVRNRNRMLFATHNIMLKIGTELHLPILLSNILEQAQSLLDADRGGGIYLYESGGDVLRLVHGTGINQGRDNITIQVGEGVAGRVYQTSQPLIIDNYTNWKAHATILVADPPSTVMGVPLLLNAKVFGVLTLIANSQLRKFTDQDMQQAEMFAAQVAVAIQNAQFYQQARQEIAERVHAEEELRESKALFETVVENVPLMIFLKEATDLHFVIFNRAGEELLGYDRQALLGKNNLDLFPPEQAAHFMAKDREVLDGEAGMLDIPEEPLQTARKGQRLLHTRKVCIRGADGTTKYLLGISEDITERKQAEQKLAQYSEHLEEMVAERTRELTDTQEKLVRHEKLATLGQLAGGMGHELRNPLSVINAAIYYLKLVQPDASDKVREYHAMIEQEVQNSEKIITDLLDFARIKSVDREAVSVSEIVQRVLERYPVPPSVTLSLDLSPYLPKIYADPRHVKQVLGNLVINACQAMKDGGKLTVDGGQLTVDGISWVRISVKDTGVGISPENMKKLFEPLFTTKTKGIGLGLSISRKLIEANGGRIEVESEPGKGSTFTLVLPVSNKPG